MVIELKKFGDPLMSRSSGREAYLAMQAHLLDGINKDEEIVLDFKGVKVMGPSWADEVISKLAQEYKNLRFINTDNPTVQMTLETLREYSDLKV